MPTKVSQWEETRNFCILWIIISLTFGLCAGFIIGRILTPPEYIYLKPYEPNITIEIGKIYDTSKYNSISITYVQQYYNENDYTVDVIYSIDGIFNFENIVFKADGKEIQYKNRINHEYYSYTFVFVAPATAAEFTLSYFDGSTYTLSVANEDQKPDIFKNPYEEE